jgi:hypothetical protein
MEDELHEVVQLLIARMEVHPEEFKYDRKGMTTLTRWGVAIESIFKHGSETEIDALKSALRVIHLKDVHEQVLDELYNGDARRDKERRDFELEVQLQQKILQQQAQQQAQQKYAQYPNATRLLLGAATRPDESLLGQLKGKLGI